MSTLTDQATRRLIELTKKHGMKAKLAKELRTSPSAITPYTQGTREVTLRMLEALSRIARVPLSELIAPDGSTTRELTPDETTLIDTVRTWPKHMSKHLIALVAYIAHAQPADPRERQLLDRYRALTEPDRNRLFDVVGMLRERPARQIKR